jgi:hypothetical protein
MAGIRLDQLNAELLCRIFSHVSDSQHWLYPCLFLNRALYPSAQRRLHHTVVLDSSASVQSFAVYVFQRPSAQTQVFSLVVGRSSRGDPLQPEDNHEAQMSNLSLFLPLLLALTELRSLTLSAVLLPQVEATVAAISRLSNLRHLNVAGVFDPKEPLCRGLVRFRWRHVQNMLGSASIRSAMIGNLHGPIHVFTWPSLQSLSLESWTGMNDDDVATILETVPAGLTALRVTACQDITHRCLDAVKRHHAMTLHTLSLSLEDDSIDDAVGLSTYFQGFPELRKVALFQSAASFHLLESLPPNTLESLYIGDTAALASGHLVLVARQQSDPSRPIRFAMYLYGVFLTAQDAAAMDVRRSSNGLHFSS